MDIVAHALWAGVALVRFSGPRPITRQTAVATVAMAAAPDLVQLLPLVGAAVGSPDGLRQAWSYLIATPDVPLGLPPWLELATHHLHCIMHSAPIAAAVTLVIWLAAGRLWLPLLGWWSHIVIDVFTHSAQFYPVPVLYPFTQRGFDGVAWTTPWFMAANYAALVLAWAWTLAWRRRLGAML